MRLLYLILALCIAALGLVHVASTPSLFDEINSRALWFASGGLLLILTGALNLLNRAYGSAARGLRRVTTGTNAVMTGFAALAGSLGAASGAQLVTIVGMMAGATIVSAMPRALSAR